MGRAPSPEYGRSVLLHASGDGTVMHIRPHAGSPLVFRAGGYWWDGQTWHRPTVTFDHATEAYVRVPVPVPDARSVTAADWLTSHPGDPARGHCVDITDFTPATVSHSQWSNDLAAWASRRTTGGRPLNECIVDVIADELDGNGALLHPSAAARAVGMSRGAMQHARTLSGSGRATRFPLPQRHTTSGQPAWSKPVLDESAWERQRDNADEVVAHLQRGIPHPGTDALIAVTARAAVWDM